MESVLACSSEQQAVEQAAAAVGPPPRGRSRHRQHASISVAVPDKRASLMGGGETWYRGSPSAFSRLWDTRFPSESPELMIDHPFSRRGGHTRIHLAITSCFLQAFHRQGDAATYKVYSKGSDVPASLETHLAHLG